MNILKRIADKYYFKYLIAILLKIVFEQGYIIYSSQLFSYQGFDLDINFWKYIISWLIYLFFVFIFPKEFKKPSDYLLTIILYNLTLPILLLYGLTKLSTDYLFIALSGISTIFLVTKSKPIKLPFIKKGYLIIFCGILFLVILSVIALLRNYDLNLDLLDLTKTYVLREEISQNTKSNFVQYLISTASKSIFPAALSISLWKRKYKTVFILFFIQIIWFLFTSHKGVILYPFFIFNVWFWFRNSKNLSFYPLTLLSIISISFLPFTALEYNWLPALLFHRSFIIPTNLIFAYYEYFQDNYIFWTNTKIGFLFGKYPFDDLPPKLIGNYLFGSGNANVSFLGAGFMHFGIIGVLIYGIIVGLLFVLVDSISHKSIENWVTVSIVLIPFQTLILSADLLSSLLSHGLALSILFLFFIRENYQKNN